MCSPSTGAVLVRNAGGGTRTPTLFPEADFESAASANSATPAWGLSVSRAGLGRIGSPSHCPRRGLADAVRVVGQRGRAGSRRKRRRKARRCARVLVMRLRKRDARVVIGFVMGWQTLALWTNCRVFPPRGTQRRRAAVTSLARPALCRRSLLFRASSATLRSWRRGDRLQAQHLMPVLGGSL